MSNEKHLMVNAIKDGTVIDHIPAANLFKVIRILHLDSCQNQITFGTNLESKRLGHKAIVKISDKFFEEEETNKIALIAPNAKLNIIKNYEVVEKREVSIPNNLVGICKCANPKCVTNVENVKTKFTVEDKENLTLRCHYCEKLTEKDQIVVIA
jgi:aspartate carbamoyltransferase, regulatory subunit